MRILEDGADERRNASEYKLKSNLVYEERCINTGFLKTEYYGHNARYIHYNNRVIGVQPNLTCMFQ